MEKRDDEDEDEPAGGNGAVIGVIFAIALTAGAIFLVQRMRDSATLFECAFTHAPQCRSLIRE